MTPPEIVLTFIDHLAAGRAPLAHQLLTPRSQLDGVVVVLKDLWRAMTTKYGSLCKRTVVASHPGPNVEVVYLLLEFQRGRFPASALCTPDGRLNTLAFGHPNEVPYLEMLRDHPA